MKNQLIPILEGKKKINSSQMKNQNRTEHKLIFTFRFSESGLRANEIDEIRFWERYELRVSERKRERERWASLFRVGTREMRGIHESDEMRESEIGFQRRDESEGARTRGLSFKRF
jgi:hypothetical protein